MEYKPTAYNQKIIAWKSATTQLLKMQIGTMTSKGKGELLNSLKGYVNFNPDGDAWQAIWKFPRHGIFLFKGVGKGYLLVDGRIVRAITRHNAVYFIDKKFVRQPADWFNSVFEMQIPKLADIMAEYWADRAVDQAIPEFEVKGINKTYKA
jgi:hypothetical protein